MSRVLVTGATGYVGRHVLEPLRERGFEVHTASRADGVDLLGPAGADALLGELRPTHLLHLAWYAEHGRFWTAEENLAWVGATLRLLRAFVHAGGRRAVVAGTCAEYAWGSDEPCDERTTPLRPATLYGAAKHGAHEVARAYAEQAGVALAWGRIFFSFGPGEPEARIVPSIARAVLAGREAPMTHGRQRRDFVTVADLGRGFAALLDSEVTGPVNVASGEGTTLAALAAMVAEAAGGPGLLRTGAIEARPGEPEVLVADARRIRDEVGWAPRDSLRDGVERAVAYWRERA